LLVESAVYGGSAKHPAVSSVTWARITSSASPRIWTPSACDVGAQTSPPFGAITDPAPNEIAECAFFVIKHLQNVFTSAFKRCIAISEVRIGDHSVEKAEHRFVLLDEDEALNNLRVEERNPYNGAPGKRFNKGIAGVSTEMSRRILHEIVFATGV
jgi:hypothetical protein